MNSKGHQSEVKTPRRGPAWSGDPSKSPRCGAKTRSGKPCRAPAMWSKKAGRYTRCKFHGGASTGPRTPEGLEACRRAATRHGTWSAAAVAERRASREAIRSLVLEGKQLTRRASAALRALREAEASRRDQEP